MPSAIGICNKALFRIGSVGGAIGSFTEASKEAKACALFYETARDRALAEYAWPFARRRVTLSLTGTAPEAWAYSYQYPTDCITALEIEQPGMRNVPTDQQIPFEIADSDLGTGRLIYTDQIDAVLIYTARIAEVARFPVLFEEAVSWALAGDLALALAAKADVSNLCREEYRRTVWQAWANALNQGHPDVPPDGERIRARGYDGSNTST